MGITARKVFYYDIQPTCDKCGTVGPKLQTKTKGEGYLELRRQGWHLRTTKKEAICGKCMED